MRRLTWAVAATLSGSLLLSGCRDVTPPVTMLNYGFVSLDVAPGGGGYVTDPSGVFFKSASPLALSRLATGEEGCDLSIVSDETGGQPLANVSAGATMTVSIGANDAILAPDEPDENGQIHYIRAVGSPLPLTPGDQFEVTFPGAPGGFPGMTAIGQTATLITPGTITVPDSGQDLLVNWDAGTPGATVAVFDLSYKSSSTATEVDRQLFCVFADDGSSLIDDEISDGWRRSVSREAVVSRFSIVSLHQDNSYLYVSSAYSVSPLILAP